MSNRMYTYKLEEIAKLVSGGTPDRERKEYYAPVGTPWIKIENLNRGKILSTAEYLSKEGCEKVNLIPKDSVLFSIVGTVGKVGIAGCKAAMNQQIVALIFNEKKVLPMYGYYLLRYHAKKIKKLANQTTMALISRKTLGQYCVQVPEDMETQRSIVEQLQRLEELVREKETLQDKAAELTVCMFNRIFADEVRYHERLPLREYLSLPISQKAVERHPAAAGDVMLRNGKALLLEAGFGAEEKADRQTCRIRTDREQLYPEVLWGYLLHPEMEKLLYTPAKAEEHRRRPITGAKLEQLPVPYFSREKQEIYKACVRKIRELEQLWEKELLLARDILEAAQERLLTGETLEEKRGLSAAPAKAAEADNAGKDQAVFYYDAKKKRISVAVDAASEEVLAKMLAAAGDVSGRLSLAAEGVSLVLEGKVKQQTGGQKEQTKE